MPLLKKQQLSIWWEHDLRLPNGYVKKRVSTCYYVILQTRLQHEKKEITIRLISTGKDPATQLSLCSASVIKINIECPSELLALYKNVQKLINIPPFSSSPSIYLMYMSHFQMFQICIVLVLLIFITGLCRSITCNDWKMFILLLVCKFELLHVMYYSGRNIVSLKFAVRLM